MSHGPSTRQPTTRSENASRTAANQNLPLPAGDPGRIGHLQAVRAAAVKSRITGSGAGVAARSCGVDPVRHLRHRWES